MHSRTAAAPESRAPTVRSLVRFSLTSGNAAVLAQFYERAFDCRRLDARRRGGAAFSRLMGVESAAQAITLSLGAQTLELLQFDVAGRPYPRGGSAVDLSFQHFAILVGDMHEAYRRLLATPGWSAISREGPQRLPPGAGAVVAFKFRDPEGHPLELLEMPAPRVPRTGSPRTAWIGIDHSAISVSDTMHSVAFYEPLGLRISASSCNSGAAQARLDDVAAPRVEVTALSAPQGRPHLELLCYRHPRPGPANAAASNDIIATRLIFSRDCAAGQQTPAPVHCIDPDGHHLIIE